MMKKIINRPGEVVSDMVTGFAAAHPEIRVLEGTQVIVRADAPTGGKVGLISGGGSGHEPAHAGYVGPGMLDAACAGDVFASPSVDQMLKAIEAVDAGSGVLVIAKNYTGDNLNFDMAMELASMQGIQTAKVVVADDVAVKAKAGTTGRRGVAGTVFVHKIAGAMAARGASLDEVKRVAEQVADNVRSFGMALSPCIIPAVGHPNFSLEDGQMELGIGIHGEEGVQKTAIMTAKELAKAMLAPIFEDMPRLEGSQIAVMVNGMGATSLMELYILYGEAAKLLKERNVTVHRVYVGEYMTSMEMAGCSISLLKLNDELKSLLDAPANTPGFKQYQ